MAAGGSITVSIFRGGGWQSVVAAGGGWGIVRVWLSLSEK